MKYKLLKDLPFMGEGTIFKRVCSDSIDCCVFGVSYHNCVKHYDTMEFSDNENALLCSIIADTDWIEVVVPKKAVHDPMPLHECTGRLAVNRYDAGEITREQLIDFIESY